MSFSTPAAAALRSHRMGCCGAKQAARVQPAGYFIPEVAGKISARSWEQNSGNMLLSPLMTIFTALQTTLSSKLGAMAAILRYCAHLLGRMIILSARQFS